MEKKKNKLPSKKEIENIVNKTFYTLGYKEKYSREYYVDLVNQTMENIDWTKSYSHKPHLASLPYDLNVGNADKLRERLDEIDNRIKDTEEEISSNQDTIDGIQNEIDNLKGKNSILEQANKDFEDIKKSTYKKDDELQKEAFDTIDDINKRLDDALGMVVDENGKQYLLQGMIDGKPNTINLDRFGLNELFEYSGLISNMDSNLIFDLSREILSVSIDPNILLNFKEGLTDNETQRIYNDWVNEMQSISKELDGLANKHNVNVHEMGEDIERTLNYYVEDNLVEIEDNNEIIKLAEQSQNENKQNKKHLETELRDYKNEYKRTESALRRQLKKDKKEED